MRSNATFDNKKCVSLRNYVFYVVETEESVPWDIHQDSFTAMQGSHNINYLESGVISSEVFTKGFVTFPEIKGLIA